MAARGAAAGCRNGGGLPAALPREPFAGMGMEYRSTVFHDGVSPVQSLFYRNSSGLAGRTSR